MEKTTKRDTIELGASEAFQSARSSILLGLWSRKKPEIMFPHFVFDIHSSLLRLHCHTSGRKAFVTAVGIKV